VIAAGIDIGSTACKAVVLADGRLTGWAIGPSTTDPAKTAEVIFEKALERAGLERAAVDRLVGTGYGRALVPFADQNVSELTCHGRGATFAAPGVVTILDIGGQDTKAISVDPDGYLVDYAMNDKCAAGTGRFLEAMARTLEVALSELDALSERADSPCAITSMCSVFAETELINLINQGVETARIAAGLHEAMASRVAGLARRVGIVEPVVVTGGVAKSSGVRKALTARLGVAPVALPDHIDPQLIGALGAAVNAAEEA